MNKINKSFFIFVLITILIFIKISYDYKIKHKKSILDESKVKKTLIDVSMIDDFYRILADLTIFFDLSIFAA